MKRVLSGTASADLARIGAYISVDNPRRAVAFLKEIRARIDAVCRQPLAFALWPGHERTGIRRAVHGRSLIFYRPDADRITVLRVLHGAMDHDSLLSGDP